MQAKSEHSLFPIDEESEETEIDNGAIAIRAKSESDLQRLEKDQQEYRHHISHFSEQFQALGDRLGAYEGLHSQNEELRCKLAQLQLQSEASQQANAELHVKVESLRSQNELLTSMTSVLDRITEENRLLESNLESAQRELRTKVEEIELLRRTEPVNSPAVDTTPQPDEETQILHSKLEQQIERLTTENQDLQRLIGERENDLIERKKTETSMIQQHQDLLSAKSFELNQIADENKTLKFRMEELENRMREESKLLREKNEVLQKKLAEAECVLTESRKTESDLDTHEQLLSSKSLELDRMTEENFRLQTRLDELENQARDDCRQLDEDNTTLKKLVEEREGELEEIQKARCNMMQQHEQMLLAKATELDRILDENNQLKKNLTSLDQALHSKSEAVEHLENEKGNLLADLNRLEQVLAAAQADDTPKVEASIQSDDHWLENQSRLEESISKMQEREQQLGEQNQELERRFVEIQEVVRMTEDHRLTLELEASQLRQQLEESVHRKAELEESNSLKTQKLDQLQSENQKLKVLLADEQNICSELRLQQDESTGSQKAFSLELEKENENLRVNCRLLEEEKVAATEGILALKEKVAVLEREALTTHEELERLTKSMTTITADREQVVHERDELLKEKELLRETLQAFQQQREQLVQTVQQKHQESVSYHSETLRLAKICEEFKVYTFCFYKFLSIDLFTNDVLLIRHD